jgi:hypothetical protein
MRIIFSIRNPLHLIKQDRFGTTHRIEARVPLDSPLAVCSATGDLNCAIDPTHQLRWLDVENDGQAHDRTQ